MLRQRRREEDEAAAVARLRDAYGEDVNLLELVERVVHGPTSRGRRAPLSRREVLDGLWAIGGARRELDRLEAHLLVAASEATPTKLRQREVAVPLGLQHNAIGPRLRRLRPLIDQELPANDETEHPSSNGVGT